VKINQKRLISLIKAIFFAFFILNLENVLADQINVQVSKDLKFFQDCEECPKMVVIPSGKIDYENTALKGFSSEFKKIVVKKPFAMSVFEITWSEWLKCVKKMICKKNPSDQGWGKANLPIINVSWFDAIDFISFLNLNTEGNYRLPTEAEWQYAARANTKSRYWWGDKLIKNYANCRICGSQWDGEQSSPVGSFKSNQFGLYDMNGNVWEWTSDCWVDKGDKQVKMKNNTSRTSCNDRVIKSGSWYYIPKLMTPEARHKFPSNLSSYNIGFRVAKDLN